MKGSVTMNKKHPLDTAKRIIKEYYKMCDCGIFDCPNFAGDPMAVIYKDDSITILACFMYSYFEVFGLSNDDFEKLKEYYNSLGKEA